MPGPGPLLGRAEQRRPDSVSTKPGSDSNVPQHRAAITSGKHFNAGGLQRDGRATNMLSLDSSRKKSPTRNVKLFSPIARGVTGNRVVVFCECKRKAAFREDKRSGVFALGDVKNGAHFEGDGNVGI